MYVAPPISLKPFFNLWSFNNETNLESNFRKALWASYVKAVYLYTKVGFSDGCFLASVELPALVHIVSARKATHGEGRHQSHDVLPFFWYGYLRYLRWIEVRRVVFLSTWVQFTSRDVEKRGELTFKTLRSPIFV